MTLITDILYAVFVTLTAPVWLVRMIHTGKIRTDWAGRLGRVSMAPDESPRVLFHAVSVGEVNAIRGLVADLSASRPDVDVVVATTTDTGYARAVDCFGPTNTVVRYPFDFGFAVRRFLRAVHPDVVVLIELEVWPNFVREATRRGTPILVINGRLSERSFARYRRLRGVLRSTFARLAGAAVQDEAYAERFRAMGVEPERVAVSGTMKWDTARIEDEVDGAAELAAALGVDRDRPLVVAGSTAPDEHRLLHEAVPEGCQLLCAPRKPEWFDQAARDLPGCVRRTTGRARAGDRFLLDTIGELRLAYALADVVVIGRTFGSLFGSDMMEPVALGKAVVTGPAIGDFQAAADALRAGDGLVQTTRDDLRETIAELLSCPTRRQELAENGRRVLRANQGATTRHLRMIMETLDGSGGA